MKHSTAVFAAVASALVISCGSYKSAYVHHDVDDVNIGYGTVDKDNLSGAVTSDRTDDRNTPTQTDMYEYLRGRFAGVMILGQGDNARIRIRGESSNSDTADPLILVNGVEVTTLSNINPSDVSSVEIIKDGTASIYGIRGGNGVILITTKGAAK